ncbi:hypothetical protein L208DRAFT_1398675 [Tricholoma matsutake]|nr:hypothetical protein L208DRAFT_1398675 [Tricholoma matsutake 945]
MKSVALFLTALAATIGLGVGHAAPAHSEVACLKICSTDPLQCAGNWYSVNLGTEESCCQSSDYNSYNWAMEVSFVKKTPACHCSHPKTYNSDVMSCATMRFISSALQLTASVNVSSLSILEWWKIPTVLSYGV